MGAGQLLLAELDVSRHLTGVQVGELLAELLNQLVGQGLHGRHVHYLEVGVEPFDHVEDGQGGDVCLPSPRRSAHQHVLYRVVSSLEHQGLDGV